MSDVNLDQLKGLVETAKARLDAGDTEGVMAVLTSYYGIQKEAGWTCPGKVESEL